jgi:anti-sigma B factor antagonist
MGVLAVTLEMESGSELLQIDVRSVEDAVVLTLSGELDIAGAPLLLERLVEAEHSGAKEVICDLEHLTYLDSTGISVLISARKRLRASGRDLVLLALSPPVTKIFDITGIGSYFTIRTERAPTTNVA